MALTKVSDAGLSKPASDLQDNEKIVLGTGNDFELIHDGSNSYIQEDGTGQLILRSWSPQIQAGYSPSSSRNTGELAIKALPDGAVELYHNAIKTFETYQRGITVFGPEADHGEVYIYADEGDNDADKWLLQSNTAGPFYLKNFADGSWETNIKAGGGGNVELYYNDTKKLETTSTGVKAQEECAVYGIEGGHAQLRLCPDEADDNNDNWRLRASNNGDIYLQNYADAAWENNLAAYGSGAVELYHDNTKVVETTGAGLLISKGGITSGQKFIIDGSGNSTGDTLYINNWGDSDGDYFDIGVNVQLNTSGNHAKVNNTVRGAAIELDARQGRFQVYTSAASSGVVSLVAEFDRDKNVRIADGNLKIGTAGHGIDFSATSDAGGMTSELLDDYEEGEWTITFTNSGSAAQDSSSHTKGRYVKIGGMVYFHFMIKFGSNGTVPPNNGTVFKSSLPFSTPSDSTNSLSRHIFTIMHQEIKMDDSRTEVVGYLTQNTSHMQYFEMGDDLPWQTLKNSNMDRTAMQMYVSGVMSTV